MTNERLVGELRLRGDRMSHRAADAIEAGEARIKELGSELDTVERAAAARAVQYVRNEIRGIPHWWNTEEQRGGFDIPPLGPNASSEEGAFMEVMRVLDECAEAYRQERGEQ